MKLLYLPGGEVKTLLEAPQGVIRDPDVHFDGQRILFSMRRNIEDDYHLYEIDLGNAGEMTSADSRLSLRERALFRGAKGDTALPGSRPPFSLTQRTA